MLNLVTWMFYYYEILYVSPKGPLYSIKCPFGKRNVIVDKVVTIFLSCLTFALIQNYFLVCCLV